jgi:predicted PurR-regulated permease PerM
MSKSWNPAARIIAAILLIGAFLWFISAAQALISPLVISALLAYVLNPGVALVNTRTRLSRRWVVLLVYLISLAALVVTAVILIPVIPSQVAALASQLEEIIRQLEESLAIPLTILGFRIPLDQFIGEIPEITLNFARPDIFLDVLRATTTNFGWLLVVLVTTYYLLQDWPRLREWLFSIAPDVYESDMRRLYAQVREVWQRYLRGQLRLMLFVGVLTGLGSAAIGLPVAWAFGFLAGLFDVILSVGPAVVMAVAALVAFFTGSNFLPISNLWFTLLVLALYSAIQTAENIWLRPRILGNSLRLHPAIVFVAVIGSLALAGVLMALIIVPLISSLFVIGRYVYCKILDVDPWVQDTAVPSLPLEADEATAPPLERAVAEWRAE